MKKLIQLKLKILAKAILAKYKPEVVGITGSVGKTGAREAVYTVLSSKFNVRRSAKNYNNEIGVPLTVIGVDSPGRSFFGWARVFWRAAKLILFRDKNYPKILIIELGVDRPGDMKYLLGVVKPKVGVITGIGESHLEFFNSVQKIKKEKMLLIEELPKSGYAVLNYDSVGASRPGGITREAKSIAAEVITYGFNEGANVRAYDSPHLTYQGDREWRGLKGINFKLNYKNSSIDVNLLNVIGRPAVEAALAGAAVGVVYGLKLDEIARALSGYRPPKGRMNLIAGVKNTLIIDDTYNSSPQSSVAALEAVSKIILPEGARRLAVLGDMLELGAFTEEGHRLVGRKVFEFGINKLIVVGEKARDIARGAREAGMQRDNIFHFPNADDARIFVQERIKEGDLILIKGSQAMRMEKIVKEIMAEPLKAKELLVRQGEEWKK
jgi:UDP-N-acetylmuramoyl-tripeptide--D-alanyl-D-alanine ligase